MRNVRKAVLFTVMTLILMACEKHVQPERTDGSVTVEETVERTVEFEIPEMTAPDVPISASSRAGESVSVGWLPNLPLPAKWIWKWLHTRLF